MPGFQINDGELTVDSNFIQMPTRGDYMKVGYDTLNEDVGITSYIYIYKGEREREVGDHWLGLQNGPSSKEYSDR